MITNRDTLSGLLTQVENDEPINFRKESTLQVLSLAIAGRQFAEQAALRAEENDDRLAEFIADLGG